MLDYSPLGFSVNSIDNSDTVLTQRFESWIYVAVLFISLIDSITVENLDLKS